MNSKQLAQILKPALQDSGDDLEAHRTLGLFVYSLASVIPGFIAMGFSMSMFHLSSGPAFLLGACASFGFVKLMTGTYHSAQFVIKELLATALVLALTYATLTAMGATSSMALLFGIGLCVLIVVFAYWCPFKLDSTELILSALLGATAGAPAGVVSHYLFGMPTADATDLAILVFSACILLVLVCSRLYQTHAAAQPYVPPHLRRSARANYDAANDNFDVNPATGLVMVDECRDVAGNLFLMGGGAVLGSEAINVVSHDVHGAGSASAHDDYPAFNPASGLLMMNDMFDTDLNIYGTTSTGTDHDYGSSFGSHDFGNSSSMFD